MWPWGHAALGYLLYAVIRRGRSRSWPPSDSSAVALAVGTQFPDLVDKPLAWTFHVLPSGRSLAHSLVTTALVVVVVVALARRVHRSAPARAFAVGYCSHLLGDALSPLLQGDVSFLSFLLWPILPPPPYENDSSFVQHLVDPAVTPMTVAGLALGLLVVGTWIRDGYPGLRWALDRSSPQPADD